MTERSEDTPSYRLGEALGLLRRLLGHFGPPHEIDRAMADEFVRREERRTQEFIDSLGPWRERHAAEIAAKRAALRDDKDLRAFERDRARSRAGIGEEPIKPLDGDSYDDAAAANEERDGND